MAAEAPALSRPTHPLLQLGPARWLTTPPPAVSDEIAAVAGNALLASLVVARGHATPEAVQHYLDPASAPRTDPLALPEVGRAVDRLARAVATGEKVLVWGDFDADGQTSTALLVLALRRVGLDPAWHVPHRGRDSHGLNEGAVDRALSVGATLVVTCDCGVTDRKHVGALRDAGIDTIVTDHHAIPPSTEPHPAVAVVSPRFLPNDHIAAGLSGVGVAYYLATGLLSRLGRHANDLLDLVALGTIADVAPLVAENRRLVWAGLPALNAGRRPGIAALLDVAKRTDADRWDASPAGWTLGPRLNAFGRLDDATTAVELLLCDDRGVAGAIAETADSLNRIRIELTDSVIAEANAMLEQATFVDGPPPPQLDLVDGALVTDSAIVMARNGWPPGVIGLAASRLAERYLRPVAMVAVQDDVARVSARSATWCNLNPVIQSIAASPTIGFQGGSHHAAAGGSLPPSNVGAFALAFAGAAGLQRGIEPLCQRWHVDAEMKLSDVTLTTCAHIARMAPFGNGNREPLFMVGAVQLAEPPRLMGEGDRHWMLTLVDARGARARAVWWGASDQELPPGAFDALVRLERNDYGELSFPRLVVIGVRPSAC